MNINMTIELLKKGSKADRNLLGVRGEKVGIGRGDLLFLDYVISRMPDPLGAIVEFGTLHGVTTSFLAICAQMRGTYVDTVDIEDKVYSHANKQYAYYHIGDLLTSVYIDMCKIIETSNCFLFVDNGNKIKETHMYAKYCGQGCHMVIHDWDDEIGIEDVRDVLNENGFKLCYEDISIALFSSCRCFVKEGV